MENTTIRTVDELGRVVLPRVFRDSLAICEKEQVTVTLKDGAIIIKKAS